MGGFGGVRWIGGFGGLLCCVQEYQAIELVDLVDMVHSDLLADLQAGTT